MNLSLHKSFKITRFLVCFFVFLCVCGGGGGGWGGLGVLVLFVYLGFLFWLVLFSLFVCLFVHWGFCCFFFSFYLKKII